MTLKEMILSTDVDSSSLFEEENVKHSKNVLMDLIYQAQILAEGNEPIASCDNNLLFKKVKFQYIIFKRAGTPEEKIGPELLNSAGAEFSDYYCKNRCPGREMCSHARVLGWVNTDISYPAKFNVNKKNIYVSPVGYSSWRSKRAA